MVREFNYFKYSLVVLFIITFCGVVYYQYWARFNICPIFDGNNCVARVSNLGLLLARSQFGEFFLKLQHDLNNFLSVIYFSIFSASIGPGRVAWGWAWLVACLALVIFQINILKRQIKWWQVLLTFLLLLICSPILSPAGGLLDQRLDLFSILFFLAAAASVYSKRFFWGGFLSIAAIYAKGPALPVFIMFWLSACCSKIVTVRQIKQSAKQSPLAFAGCIVLLTVYCVWFLPTVIHYNLMSVKSSAASTWGIIQGFIFAAANNVFDFSFFYIKSLLVRSPCFFILIFLALMCFYKKRDQIQHDQRCLLIWGFSFFGLTYLLFTSHPVHARVLDLWFLPSIWLLILAISQELKNTFFYVFILFLITIKLFFTFKIIFIDQDKNSTYHQYCGHMMEQAAVLSDILEKKSHLSGKVIRILPNFLYFPTEGIAFSYDTYRVLLFESLGKKSPILEGWELGTYSDHWISEISSGREVWLAMIVVDGSDAIHFRNKANMLAKEYIANVNLACEIKNVQGARVPHFGSFRFFLTEGGFTTCF
jgi:hypothetical protein